MEKTKQNLEGVTLIAVYGRGLETVPQRNRPEYFIFNGIQSLIFFLKDNFDYLYEKEHRFKSLEGNFCGQDITLHDLWKAGYLEKLWSKDKLNTKYCISNKR